MVEWRHLKFVTSAARPETSKGHAISGPIAFSPPSPSTLPPFDGRRQPVVLELKYGSKRFVQQFKISAGVARRGKRALPNSQYLHREAGLP
jgi:hypothetical protein